jgi:hypothetical protein
MHFRNRNTKHTLKTSNNPWLALMVMSVLSLSGANAQTDKVDNRLPNPSFEAAEEDRPAGWRSQLWGGQAHFGHDTIGRTGDRSARIASEQGADASWTVTVPVEPHGRYRLTGWIRTENVRTDGGRGALLNVHGLAAAVTPALTGDNDWKPVEVEFDVVDQDAVQVNALFGGWGNATGTAWFDDVRLEMISQREESMPRHLALAVKPRPSSLHASRRASRSRIWVWMVVKWDMVLTDSGLWMGDGG